MKERLRDIAYDTLGFFKGAGYIALIFLAGFLMLAVAIFFVSLGNAGDSWIDPR